MFRKSFWVLAALIVIGGSFWLGNYTRDYLFYARDYAALSKLPAIIAGSTNPEPGAAYSTTSPATMPAASGTSNSTGSVKVTAITTGSITVQTGFSQTKTFAISSTTPVYSAVFAGQTGKGISDISVGNKIVVYSYKTDPDKVSALAIARDPSLEVTGYDTNLSVTGIITKLSGSEATITPSSPGFAPVTVTLDPSTKLITIVTSGQKGRNLGESLTVTASGLSTAGGKTTAKLITIAWTSDK